MRVVGKASTAERRGMRALAVALLLAAGCSGRPGGLARTERAITNATDDDGDPAVVALVDPTGQPYCTGTLITPAAVLTAAHCVDDVQPATVYFGPTPGVGGETVAVTRTQMHPLYDPDTHDFDVGIVVLAASPDVEPVRVYARPFDDSFLGKSIRLVGFGLTGLLDSTDARKRWGDSRIRAYTARDFSFSAEPSQTCFGDSGGPAFGVVNGLPYLLGITSTGDAGCVAGGTDVLVGAFEAGFVEGYLSGTASPTVVGGCAAAPGAPSGLGLIVPAIVGLRLRRRARAR
jgi:Trypsin